MTLNGWLQIIIFVVALTLITKPIGLYLAAVFSTNPQEGSRGAPSSTQFCAQSSGSSIG